MKDSNLYVLFHCNEWKDWTSMTMIGVFTFDKLEKIIEEKIGKDEYSGWIDTPFESLSIRQINELMKYGYVEEVKVNEIL